MIHHTYQLHFLGMTLGDRRETSPQATMSVRCLPFFILIYLTFIFSSGLLYHVAGLLHPDPLVDLMIATFQNALNCPIEIPSICSIGQIIIDLVPQVGLVAHQALIILTTRRAIQTRTTGSALLHGEARLLWRSS